MKKAEAPVYIWHWIMIIVGISTALLVRSHLQKSDGGESVPVEPAHNASDTRFVAVLYPGISRTAKSDSMSRSMFREHMTELKSAGYCTVGLQQVCDFYDANKLLPDKAVVVLLDGHRDTGLNAVPVVEELGLQATVMLNVGAMRQTSRSFISWHDLKKMQKDPHWDFGIRTGAADDLPEQVDYLKDHFPGIRVCGVSAPTDLSDSVTFSRDKRVFFPPRGGDGYNSNLTDPCRLSLLRVAPQQGGRELVKTLANIFSQAPRVEDGFTEDAVRLSWVSTCGNTRVVDGMLELSAGPSQSSADAWSAGTYEWGDVDLSAEFKITGGRQFWTYLRFRSEDNFIRVGCDGRRLLIQQKVAGAKVNNLKVIGFDHDFSQFRTLRVILRGPYAIVSVDGRKLSARPFRVDNSLVSGKVGFAIWDPANGVARCRIARTAIRKLPCIALMNMGWYEDSSGPIAEHYDYLSYLCPNGLSVNGSPAEHSIDDYNRLLISSAYNGHTLAPTVELGQDDLKANGSDVLADKLAGLAKNSRLEGLHLDCRNWRGGTSIAGLAEIVAALKVNLPELTLILSLSPQCYQTCEELAKLADVLVLRLEERQHDWLGEIPRPVRLKTLLRIETEEPSVLTEGLLSLENGPAMYDSADDLICVVKDYELKGVALCRR